MGIPDLAAGMRLKSEAGWNQTEADWQWFLNDPWCHCLAAVHDGRVIGTVAAVRYSDDLGWIGMLLVDRAFRRIGVGRRLLEQALHRLSGCDAVKLDATPEGKKLYDTLGFAGERTFARLTHACLPALPAAAADPDLEPITGETWPGVQALDQFVFGANRSRLLRALASRAPERAFCLVRGGARQVEGFCLARPGANYYQIGPVVAPSAQDAVLLARTALAGLQGRAVVLDVPDAPAAPFGEWLQTLGFAQQRLFVRMVHSPAKPAPVAAPPDRLFAICGPEFG